MDPIKISFTWTVDDMVMARRWHFRRLHGPAFGVALLIILGLIHFGIAFQRNDPPIMSVFTFGLGVATYCWAYPKLTRWLTKLQFTKRPDANMTIEWTVSPEVINVFNSLSKAEIQWAAFAKVLRTPDGYLFYPNNQVFHFLPKRGFQSDDDFERLGMMAAERAKKYSVVK